MMDDNSSTSSVSPIKRSIQNFGNYSREMPLPFYKSYTLKWADQIPMNPGAMVDIISENCGSKILIGGLGGYVLGLGCGLFMGAMGSDTSPIQVIQGREVPQAPLREQLRIGLRLTASRSIGWAKNFGVLTALFGGVECVIEKLRGKHDLLNNVYSGCAVGATLGAKSGAGASCLGCVGFAGFSIIVDQIFSGDH